MSNRALPVCGGPACHGTDCIRFGLLKGREAGARHCSPARICPSAALSDETALQLHPPSRCPELLGSSVCRVPPAAVQLPCKSNCNPIPRPALPRTSPAVACAVSHLWLGNLMKYPTEKTLRQEFERFGEAEDVRGGCCIRGLSSMGGCTTTVCNRWKSYAERARRTGGRVRLGGALGTRAPAGAVGSCRRARHAPGIVPLAAAVADQPAAPSAYPQPHPLALPPPMPP